VNNPTDLVSIEVGPDMWERFFTVSPLVLVGTKEESGEFDLAPKHMAFPLGWAGYFGFVCTPEHQTYWNTRREAVFTVSYPRPTQVVLTSLAASPRDVETGCKESLRAIPTFPAQVVDGVLLEDGYLYFECELDRVLDDLGANSLIIGRIVAAHARAEALRHADVSDQEMIFETPLLAYLHPGRFSQIRRSLRFPFYEAPLD
jgi:flavin reductase (DIM6/NTAB) family NADH-FMN oxidoreductase RutF